MKPYFKVFAKDSSYFTVCISKDIAKQERRALQKLGFTKVYIRMKKGSSSLSDYHKGGY